MSELAEQHPSFPPEPSLEQEYINSVLSGIMHDLRNVLTCIIGSAEVAEMSADAPEMKGRLNDIIRSGEQGSELVKLLYHLMHGDKSAPARIRLQELLPDVIRRARQQLPTGIHLNLDVDDALPSLFGYAAQIEQMLLQLIDNAAHAIKGDGSIGIYVQRDEAHALALPGLPAVCLRITDSGPGITAAKLPHVPEPLWTTRRGKGASGLGLSMVQRIIAWHHGNIAIHPAADGGCEISIHLPPHAAS